MVIRVLVRGYTKMSNWGQLRKGRRKREETEGDLGKSQRQELIVMLKKWSRGKSRGWIIWNNYKKEFQWGIELVLVLSELWPIAFMIIFYNLLQKHYIIFIFSLHIYFIIFNMFTELLLNTEELSKEVHIFKIFSYYCIPL